MVLFGFFYYLCNPIWKTPNKLLVSYEREDSTDTADSRTIST